MAARTGTAMSRLGLGASRIGSFNNPASLRDSERLVRAALDLGVRVIDTASIYGQGDSERTIGRAIAGRRDDAFVVTKGARSFSAKYRLARPLKPILRPLLSTLRQGAQVATARREDALIADWSPRRIVESLDDSLRRLRTDRVDAYLLHSPPPDVASDPAVAATLDAIRRSGKALLAGVSCDDLPTLDAALGQDALDIVELPWIVIAQLGGRGATLRARGIMVICREVIAQQPDRTPAEALRLSLSHPAIDCTLIGTTRLRHLHEAAGLVPA